MAEPVRTPEETIAAVLAGDLDEHRLWSDVPDGRYFVNGYTWQMDEHGMRAVEWSDDT